MTKLDAIFNYSRKKRKWYSWNFFYFGTIFILVALTLAFYFLEDQLAELAGKHDYINGALLQSFRHQNVYFMVMSLVSLFIIGLVLERQYGTFTFIFMFFAFSICANFASNGIGASAAIYCFYGFILLAIILNFKRFMLSGKQSILNWISLILIILLCCWSGNKGNATKIEDLISFFKFSEYVGLWDRFAHLNAFIIGGIIGLFCFVPQRIIRKEKIEATMPRIKY